MPIIRLISSAAILITLGTNALSAQALRDADAPAEMPPSGYSNSQYVDSQGCVFIRAGFDDSVVWVPRVTRDRKQLCGFAPSTAATASAAAVEPVEPIRVASVSALKIAVVPPKTRQVAAVASAKPASVKTKLPKGYRAAWTDGRLNAQRGARTAAGDAQMQMLWTNTVPRKLIVNR